MVPRWDMYVMMYAVVDQALNINIPEALNLCWFTINSGISEVQIVYHLFVGPSGLYCITCQPKTRTRPSQH